MIGHGKSLATAADHLIPFIPEFVWIYHTLIPVIFFTIVTLIKTKRKFFIAYNASFMASLILFAFFIFMPTDYPRFALEAQPDLSFQLLKLTHIIDKTNNTFPSTHVTFSCLIFLIASNTKYLKDYNFLRAIYFTWALSVSLSTLFLKQHYMLDVASGIILAMFCYYASRKMINLIKKEVIIQVALEPSSTPTQENL
jgi:membrane-associated phospholipid phosphatase